jgi:hypothetical protein
MERQMRHEIGGSLGRAATLALAMAALAAPSALAGNRVVIVLTPPTPVLSPPVAIVPPTLPGYPPPVVVSPPPQVTYFTPPQAIPFVVPGPGPSGRR